MDLSRIADNVSAVRERIRLAGNRSGRSCDAVKLVAVSKYAAKEDGMIDALTAAGCRDLGESRPQSLIEKATWFSGQELNLNWHLIGSLQKNKVRRVLPFVSLIHSLDSISLIETVDRIVAEESLPPVNGLLEVNISGDATKQGFRAQELATALEIIAGLRNIRIRGLMCMSGLHSTDDERRAEFAATRILAEKLAADCPDNCLMHELSMGMSDDFPIAIEEGATLVRIGSSLYQDVLF